MHNLEWYRVFYWAAKLGSLTLAARQLNITQPAVSHTLKHLEEAQGTNLFVRTTKGVTLTSDGEVLYPFVEQALQFIESGERTIADRQGLLTGEIRIGASDTLSKHYLLPYLEQFHQQYPGIRIRMINRTTPETLALLKEGAIDFGVVHLPAEDPRVHVRKAARQQDILVGGQKYKALADQPLSLRQIAQFPLLLLEQGVSTRASLDAYARSQDMIFHPEFELGSVDLLVRFAQSGFGLTFVVRDYVREELASGALVEIPLDPPVPERHIGIATLDSMPLPVAARQLVDMMEGQAETE
ncbi:LysR family transcriptional regulator [Paenibacillus daejeonensis]|uniref:LysR family transcriptional regulator n=1 Tax=Paenibacillus daejeonensis TaxID=135193 RepID=UPI00035F5770